MPTYRNCRHSRSALRDTCRALSAAPGRFVFLRSSQSQWACGLGWQFSLGVARRTSRELCSPAGHDIPGPLCLEVCGGSGQGVLGLGATALTLGGLGQGFEFISCIAELDQGPRGGFRR